MATTDVPVDNGEDAFRNMGAPLPDIPPYTGPDLALRWQWSDAGARLAVVPVQADNGGAEAEWPYTQRPEEEYYDDETPDYAARYEYEHGMPDSEDERDYDEDERYDSEDERYARGTFDIRERDGSGAARWDDY
jgi:hypothetical protein